MLAPPQRSMLFCFVSSDASNVSPWKITLLPYSAGGHGHGYLLLALYIRTCVFGEPDAKRQCVLLMCNLLSEKCIFWSTFVYMKYLWLLTSGAGLRVFWKSASWVILLRSAQIKFSISSLDGLLIFFVNGGQASSTFVAISNKSNLFLYRCVPVVAERRALALPRFPRLLHEGSKYYNYLLQTVTF